MRKYLILCFLVFSYIIVLGHGLIPHTHHNHHNESKYHQHHSDNHQHNHDENHDEKNDDLDDFLAHFPHSSYTTDIKFTLANDVNELEDVYYVNYLIKYDFSFEVILSDKESPPDIVAQIHSDYISNSSSLRAPPLAV
ncbi:MAG: hypothetical protein ACLGGV_08485 [Bacteroidia bacterium]